MKIPKWRQGRLEDIYKDEPKKPFASNRHKEKAMISAWFLVEKAYFTIALDHGISVEENNGRFEHDSDWVLLIDGEALKYSSDIEKMRTAISDFWHGWEAHKELN